MQAEDAAAEHALRVLAKLGQNTSNRPSVRMSVLLEHSDMDIQTLAYSLEILMDRKLVTMRREGKEEAAELTEMGQKMAMMLSEY